MITTKSIITCDRCGQQIENVNQLAFDPVGYRQIQIRYINDDDFYAKLGEFCPECMEKIIKFCKKEDFNDT